MARGHLPRGPSGSATLLAAAALLLSAAGPAGAQTDDRSILNPPRIDIYTGVKTRGTRMALPKDAPAAGREKQLDLVVGYADSALYNPATGRKDPVRLRSYSGATVDPGRPYVAPIIEVAPGDTVRITLHNKLPADPTCAESSNEPHCFNGTNLHTHGLWINPEGNSDNVLLSINPGVSFQYEYNIPPDHPAGTFWYHSHRHGSTALQVASGMAGALIVRGNRLPTADDHGDIDTLLKARDGTPLPERILVLQQIQYACLDANGNIKMQRNEAGAVTAWICEPDDVGGIEFYQDPAGNPAFGPGTWNESGRYTSINGIVLPAFHAKAGQIERWRLIHGGVRDTIDLQVRALKPDAGGIDRLKAADADRFIAENCTGEPVPYFQIAADGLTMARARPVTQTTLQPGYRWDTLMVFPKPGKYCLINAAVPAAASISRTATNRRLLGIVKVEGGKPVADIAAHVQGQLIAAARRTMPKDVRAAVVADIQNGFKLTSFTPHDDIADGEVTGTQELTFFIDTTVQPPQFLINGRAYDPDRVDRILKLGGVDEWTLRSRFASHPFHIHINPFQVVRILDPQGRDVSAEGAVDDAGGSPDPQYPGLKGVWKDTLWVKSLTPPAAAGSGTYTVVIRSRYQRYIGEFVLHCHILDHEDQGMMENVRIDLPDGKGGTTFRHH
jgi:FtsP/CotA-like multicopper oxidase with cupredoxin domain